MLGPLCLAVLLFCDTKPNENANVLANDVTFQLVGDGKIHLSDVKTDYVLLVFMGCDCPLVAQYLPSLEEFPRKESTLSIIGLMPNWQDSKDKIAKFVQEHHVSFPVARDENATMADKLGVTRTPEVVLLDKSRQVCYRGAIDDRYGINFRRTMPRHHYVADAIEDLKAGRTVTLPSHPAVGCLIGRAPDPQGKGGVTWYGSVYQIFQQRCHECHRPNHVAPFSLLTYDEAAGWAAMIREVVTERRMPPWYASDEGEVFANDCRLTSSELQDILTWIDEGAPAGDPSKAPPARVFVDEWTEKPDEVLTISDTPIPVPATGPAIIERFTIVPNWKEGRWIKSVECRPGAREAVHHLAVFVVAPSEDPKEHWSHRLIDILFGYSPGMTGLFLPQGMAKYVPPGAHLLMEVHYVPTGQTVNDLSAVGLRFEEPERVTHLVRSRVVVNAFPLEIKPNDPDAVISGDVSLPRDSLLVGMTGHAHVRCKTFRFVATFPDGHEKLLLNIPNYDMFWQQFYVLKDYRDLPKGTVVECVAHYDNSAKNPRNPDPNMLVIDGDANVFQEEMMNGFLILAEKKPETLPTIADIQPIFPWYKVVMIYAYVIGAPIIITSIFVLTLILVSFYILVRRLFRRKVA